MKLVRPAHKSHKSLAYKLGTQTVMRDSKCEHLWVWNRILKAWVLEEYFFCPF